MPVGRERIETWRNPGRVETENVLPGRQPGAIAGDKAEKNGRKVKRGVNLREKRDRRKKSVQENEGVQRGPKKDKARRGEGPEIAKARVQSRGVENEGGGGKNYEVWKTRRKLGVCRGRGLSKQQTENRENCDGNQAKIRHRFDRCGTSK